MHEGPREVGVRGGEAEDFSIRHPGCGPCTQVSLQQNRSIGDAAERAPGGLHAELRLDSALTMIGHGEAQEGCACIGRRAPGKRQLQTIDALVGHRRPVLHEAPIRIVQGHWLPIRGKRWRNHRFAFGSRNRARNLQQSTVGHRKHVEGAECAIGGADVRKRDPLIARRQHVVRLQMKLSGVGLGNRGDHRQPTADHNAKHCTTPCQRAYSHSIAHLALPPHDSIRPAYNVAGSAGRAREFEAGR